MEASSWREFGTFAFVQPLLRHRTYEVDRRRRAVHSAPRLRPRPGLCRRVRTMGCCFSSLPPADEFLVDVPEPLTSLAPGFPRHVHIEPWAPCSPEGPDPARSWTRTAGRRSRPFTYLSPAPSASARRWSTPSGSRSPSSRQERRSDSTGAPRAPTRSTPRDLRSKARRPSLRPPPALNPSRFPAVTTGPPSLAGPSQTRPR